MAFSLACKWEPIQVQEAPRAGSHGSVKPNNAFFEDFTEFVQLASVVVISTSGHRSPEPSTFTSRNNWIAIQPSVTVCWRHSTWSVASPRRGMGVSGTPLLFRPLAPKIYADPLKSVLYMRGRRCPLHAYWNFLLPTSKEKLFGPPTFLGWRRPCI